MFYKNINLYGLMSFDKKNYDKILQKIKKSRAYTSYIDRKNDNGIENPRFKNYITLKQAAYTKSIMYKNNDNEDQLKVYAFISPDSSISPDKIDNFISKHGIQDDYEYMFSMEEKYENHYIAIHEVIPIEHSVFYTTLNLDDNLERIDRQYLSENFVMGNYRRFFLLPFIGKYETKLVKPIIIATVYDVGMITIQLSIGFSQGNPDISNNEPNHIEFNDVQFYKKKETYSTKDFWNKTDVGNATIYDIMDYYFNLLKIISGDIELQPEKNKQIAWVLGDLKKNNKEKEHSTFINRNKKMYVSKLTNANKYLIEQMSEDNLNETLINNSITKLKTMHFYSSEEIALLSFSSLSYNDEILSQINMLDDEFQEEETKNSIFENVSKEYIEFDMFEFLRFYELTFIKKYYALRLFVKSIILCKIVDNVINAGCSII